MNSSLVSTDPITAERVTAAISWFIKNQLQLESSLPIRTPRITYGVGIIESIAKYISLWQQGNLALNLAVSYIHSPLSKMKKAQSLAKPLSLN